MNATPRPWYMEELNPDEFDITTRQGGKTIAMVDCDAEECKANASLIVRAVNAHDALVEALKNARDLLIEKRILVPETAIKIKQAILLAEGK